MPDFASTDILRRSSHGLTCKHTLYVMLAILDNGNSINAYGNQVMPEKGMKLQQLPFKSIFWKGQPCEMHCQISHRTMYNGKLSISSLIYSSWNIRQLDAPQSINRRLLSKFMDTVQIELSKEVRDLHVNCSSYIRIGLNETIIETLGTHYVKNVIHTSDF